MPRTLIAGTVGPSAYTEIRPIEKESMDVMIVIAASVLASVYSTWALNKKNSQEEVR